MNETVYLKVIRQVSRLYTGRPEPPYDVRVLSCTTDFVEVTWVTSGDNNSPIVEYIVYYTDSSAENPDELVEGPGLVAGPEGSTPGSTLSALIVTKPWVKYEFYVVARNSIGTSEKASQSADGTPAVCFTPETAPRRNPKDVCVRLGRANQLVIVWKVSGVDQWCPFAVCLSVCVSLRR